MAQPRIFGIDLGTTYSCIAYCDESGLPVVVKNAEDDDITPSVVHFEEGGAITVGKAAKKIGNDADRTVLFIKRRMGDPNFTFSADSTAYTPEMISSFVLRKVVGDARDNLCGHHSRSGHQ